MDWSNTFFVRYFFLILASLVMIVNSILEYRQHKRISIYTIVIILSCLVLAGSKALQDYAKETLNVPLTTFCSFLAYVLNPFCIFFFIMMSGEVKNKKNLIVLLIPLFINVLIYSMMFIPPLKKYVVYFVINDNAVRFIAQYPFRFASHIISAIYLVFLGYISFIKISNKHFWHGMTLIICSLFVVIAVVIESFFNDQGTIDVLNTTIAFSTVIYYLFLYMERTQVDALTGVFNRETYYRDMLRMGKNTTGIIQFDMNGLKYINDTFGHLEGDKAIAEIASLIRKSIKRNMFVYRLGGDEFTLLSINAKEEQIINVVNEFNKRIKETKYCCSVGYSIKKDRLQTINDLFKEAEEMRYKNNDEFYKNASFERREH